MVGIDIIDASHYEIDYYKKIYLKVLSPIEIIELIKLSPEKKTFYTLKIFSVKESILKTTGMGMRYCHMNDITIYKNKLGCPKVKSAYWNGDISITHHGNIILTMAFKNE